MLPGLLKFCDTGPQLAVVYGRDKKGRTKETRMLFVITTLFACDNTESAVEEWINAVHIDSEDTAQDLGFHIYTDSTDQPVKCGDLAKCFSWETMNPLTDGAVVADTDIEIGGTVVAAGEDLSGEDIFVDYSGQSTQFPAELYAYDEYSMGFDADAVVFSGDVGFTFTWVDADGAEYGDSVTLAGGGPGGD